MPIDVSNAIAACSVIICPPVAHYSLIQTTGLTPSIYLVFQQFITFSETCYFGNSDASFQPTVSNSSYSQVSKGQALQPSDFENVEYDVDRCISIVTCKAVNR